MDLQTSKDFSKLIGLSYAEFNCWDVCHIFYKDFLGIELKQYYSVDPKKEDERNNLISSNVGDFEKVIEPKFGDLILIKLNGIESHIGVFLTDVTFLHTTEKTGCIIDRTSRWVERISGYYRVRKETEV